MARWTGWCYGEWWKWVIEYPPPKWLIEIRLEHEGWHSAGTRFGIVPVCRACSLARSSSASASHPRTLLEQCPANCERPIQIQNARHSTRVIVQAHSSPEIPCSPKLKCQVHTFVKELDLSSCSRTAHAISALEYRDLTEKKFRLISKKKFLCVNLNLICGTLPSILWCSNVHRALKAYLHRPTISSPPLSISAPRVS